MNPPKTASGLGQRALTAVILAPLGILAVLYLPTYGFALLLGTLFAIGLREWARLAGVTSLPMQMLYALIGIAAMAAAWYLGVYALRAASVAGVVFWCIAPIWLGCFEFGKTDTRAHQALKLTAGLLAIVPAWCAGVFLHGSGDRSAWWVLFVVVLIWCADVFAYFAGRSFGKRKLAPRISPGKTWAGVGGAFAGAALYALACGYFAGIAGNALIALIGLSMVTVAFSIFGDLFESLIKRHSGEKDSGQLFPGHGGVLDRFDSLFAALPIFVVGKLFFAP